MGPPSASLGSLRGFALSTGRRRRGHGKGPGLVVGGRGSVGDPRPYIQFNKRWSFGGWLPGPDDGSQMPKPSLHRGSLRLLRRPLGRLVGPRCRGARGVSESGGRRQAACNLGRRNLRVRWRAWTDCVAHGIGSAVALGTGMRPGTSAAAFRGLHQTVGVPVDAP